MPPFRTVELEDYLPLVGEETIERIKSKAKPLRDYHVAHMNSTYYGGGVAQLLAPLTLLMNKVGVRTGWRVMHGSPDFFSTTKKIHNALQGDEINLTDRKMEIYEQIVYENSIRNHLSHDLVVIHDPQPLPIINHYQRPCPWVWVCHLDMSNPNRELWNYLTPFVEKYQAVVFSQPDYRQDLSVPQHFIVPAIDPFAMTNKPLTEAEIAERLAHYKIPTDLPLVVQISRFDRWKDPKGVINSFRLARREVNATLVLLGNVATDDPEGQEVYQSLLDAQEERIIILSRQDGALVNALQRRAAVVIQKSIREGFGLTVAEAMWKGAAVVGGNASGIRSQITDGVNGFITSTDEETAKRIVQLIRDPELRARLGVKARETVQRHFLLTRYLEDFLDLIHTLNSGVQTRAQIEAQEKKTTWEVY